MPYPEDVLGKPTKRIPEPLNPWNLAAWNRYWKAQRGGYKGARLGYVPTEKLKTAGITAGMPYEEQTAARQIYAWAQQAEIEEKAKPPAKPLAATEGVDYVTIGDYIVPIMTDKDGNRIYDWDNAKLAREKEKPPTTYPRQEGQPQTWTDESGTIWSWDDDKNDYVRTGYDPTQNRQRMWEQEQAEAEEKRQQELMAWYREQAQMQAEQQKQAQLANLRANPASWLEYASLAGTTPAVQPWMLPLMGQQYAGATAGQALPGYQAGGTSMASLAQLTTPSRQYQARMGPTALAQYGGYERARTGITPEEMQWRLWGQAPPGGSYSGLRWNR